MKLEELEERKRVLELQQEIAALESRAKWQGVASNLSWMWVAPLGFIGFGLILLGLGNTGMGGEAFAVIFVGFTLAIPTVLKLVWNR